MTRPAAGDPVQTPLGKGVVLEDRGRSILVEVAGRKVVVDLATVKPIAPARKASRGRRPAPLATPRGDGMDEGLQEPRRTPAEVDLHGLTVADALVRVEEAMNDALLDGRLQLRIIHGRGGGRIKSAVHKQLRSLPPVRAVRLDPSNAGVTIVDL